MANNVTDQVRQAWNLQREGRSETAVAEFQKIVQQHPNDMDANYGLGLAQKKANETEAAIQTFNKTLELIEKNRKAHEARRDPNDLDNIRTPEDDRLQMLSRMVRQRLSELSE